MDKQKKKGITWGEAAKIVSLLKPGRGLALISTLFWLARSGDFLVDLGAAC